MIEAGLVLRVPIDMNIIGTFLLPLGNTDNIIGLYLGMFNYRIQISLATRSRSLNMEGRLTLVLLRISLNRNTGRSGWKQCSYATEWYDTLQA